MQLRQTVYYNWKGSWNSLTAYLLSDIVEHSGTSYVCILNHTNQEPPNLLYWNILAEKGDSIRKSVV